MVMVALDAHGYGEVAQHPESIFSEVDIGAISSRRAADGSIAALHSVNARAWKSCCRRPRASRDG